MECTPEIGNCRSVSTLWTELGTCHKITPDRYKNDNADKIPGAEEKSVAFPI
jgi:hypothetical protein